MKRLRTALVFALALGLAVAAGLLIRSYGFGTMRVAGSSMEDTLRGGDLALVTRLDVALSPIRRGDVVECRFPGREDTYVKRIIGLPGDAVKFSQGKLILNGEPVGEPYVSSATDDYSITLGADEYLALGDNRAESYDSRMDDMGPIRASDILGRARWILWPPGRFGPIR